MIATIQTMIRRLSPLFSKEIKNNNLGRWNSVIKPVPVEKNKYIDWGNMDHCCCSFIEKKSK
tara:strand:- start:49 stop:234 length:186 start_codon:yes stop_codon:yes gene_type:complete